MKVLLAHLQLLWDEELGSVEEKDEERQKEDSLFLSHVKGLTFEREEKLAKGTERKLPKLEGATESRRSESVFWNLWATTGASPSQGQFLHPPPEVNFKSQINSKKQKMQPHLGRLREIQ